MQEMQDFIGQYQSYYIQYSERIGVYKVTDHIEDQRARDCLVFLGIPNVSDFMNKPDSERNEIKACISKCYRKMALIFHPDKVSEGKSKELATKLTVLLNTAKEIAEAYFNQPLRSTPQDTYPRQKETAEAYFKKPRTSTSQDTYLRQEEKISQYQYEYNDHRRCNSYFYKELIIMRSVTLQQNWEDDVAFNALAVYGESTRKNNFPKTIIVNGETAFYYLLTSGVIWSYASFDEDHCRYAVEKATDNLKHKILTHANSSTWMRSKDRKAIAQQLIKQPEYYASALTNEHFNALLTIDEVCKIAYQFQSWKPTPKSPEAVFIYYYDNYPELLRVKDFLALENFSITKIIAYITENSRNVAYLNPDALIALIEKADCQALIFSQPIAFSKIIENTDVFSQNPWYQFVIQLIDQLYPSDQACNDNEKQYVTQFFMGKLSANFLSEQLKEKIKSYIAEPSNHLPAWMNNIWLESTDVHNTNNQENDQPEKIAFESSVVIELYQGNFSVLNYVSRSVLNSLLKNPACKNFSDNINKKIHDPTVEQEDLPQAEKKHFLSQHLATLVDLFKSTTKKYLSSDNEDSTQLLTEIKALHNQIKKLDSHNMSVLQYEVTLKNTYDENEKKLCRLGPLNLSQQAKSAIQKHSALCVALEIEKRDSIAKQPFPHCLFLLIKKIICDSEKFRQDEIYQANQINGEIFGIKITTEFDTLDALEQLFTVCQLLQLTDFYFDKLEFLLNKKKAFRTYRERDFFPKEDIKTLVLAWLRNEFAVFVDGEREVFTEKRMGGWIYLSNRYNTKTFEFIKKSYSRLGAEKEYKKGLSEAYDRIEKGEVPLEKYYEIRQFEKDTLCPELEHATLQQELADVSKAHFAQPSTKKQSTQLEKAAQAIAQQATESTHQQKSLQLEGKKNASNTRRSQQIVPAQPQHPSVNKKTENMLKKLGEIADNYDPKNPQHVEFIQDFKSSTLSPILSETFQSVDVKNKNSVKKAAKVTLEKYQGMTISRNVEKTINIKRKIAFKDFKEAQKSILEKYIRERIFYALNSGSDKNPKIAYKILDTLLCKNFLYIKDFSIKSTSIDSCNNEIIEISQFISNEVSMGKIIKFLFMHLNKIPDLKAAIKFFCSSKPEQDVDKKIDLLLQVLQQHPSRDNEFPEKVAKLIALYDEKKQPINVEAIKNAIDSGEIYFAEFYYKYKDNLPPNDLRISQLTKIFADQDLKEAFQYIIKIGVNVTFRGYNSEKIYTKTPASFTPQEIQRLINCGIKSPANFNRLSSILSANFFNKADISAFCDYIQALSTAGQTVNQCDLGNGFSHVFSDKIKRSSGIVPVILKYTQQLTDIYHRVRGLTEIENIFREEKIIDPDLFEFAILIESSTIEDKKAVYTMDFDKFSEYIYNNFWVLPNNLEEKKFLIEHLSQTNSLHSLYLLCCFSVLDLESQFFTDDERGNLFSKMLKRLRAQPSPYSALVKNCVCWLEQVIIKLDESEQLALESDIDWLVSHFELPTLSAKMRYDHNNKVVPVMSQTGGLPETEEGFHGDDRDLAHEKAVDPANLGNAEKTGEATKNKEEEPPALAPSPIPPIVTENQEKFTEPTEPTEPLVTAEEKEAKKLLTKHAPKGEEIVPTTKPNSINTGKLFPSDSESSEEEGMPVLRTSINPLDSTATQTTRDEVADIKNFMCEQMRKKFEAFYAKRWSFCGLSKPVVDQDNLQKMINDWNKAEVNTALAVVKLIYKQLDFVCQHSNYGGPYEKDSKLQAFRQGTSRKILVDIKKQLVEQYEDPLEHLISAYDIIYTELHQYLSRYRHSFDHATVFGQNGISGWAGQLLDAYNDDSNPDQLTSVIADIKTDNNITEKNTGSRQALEQIAKKLNNLKVKQNQRDTVESVTVINRPNL